jgi:hypothetical protein
VVITEDFESSNTGSNPVGTFFSTFSTFKKSGAKLFAFFLSEWIFAPLFLKVEKLFGTTFSKGGFAQLFLKVAFCPISLVVEHQSCKLKVEGSIPLLGYFFMIFSKS